MPQVKKAIIITTSELATDYRLHKLSETISKAGYHCEFLCRVRSSHLKYNSTIKINYLKTIFQSSPFFYLIYNIRIFFFLLFRKTDLIVSVDLDTLVGCGLASIFKKSVLLFDSHEYFPESPEIHNKPLIKNIWLLAQNLFVPKIDIGVTVCDSIADIYKKRYKKDFLVIRNAPLSDRANTAQIKKQPDKVFTILYQGAVNYGRALQPLIESMDFIEGAQLVIIGNGDIYDDMLSLTKKRGNKVKMIGKVPHEELIKYTLNADLGISLLENFGLNNYYALPNRLFDALHAELPMLGINFPEIRKFIEENKFGCVIDSIAPEDIAAAINAIKSNPIRLNEWKNNARNNKVNINWESEIKPLMDILEK
ncbi:MAG: glycosyltransferase [Bacteroidales bacterium]|nr:glycosyltransferase [Bacteroidales bacterium]